MISHLRRAGVNKDLDYGIPSDSSWASHVPDDPTELPIADTVTEADKAISGWRDPLVMVRFGSVRFFAIFG
jgi:hypothetical protein